MSFTTPGPSLFRWVIRNADRQWIQHGDNVITLPTIQSDSIYFVSASLEVNSASDVTTRGPYHNTNQMSLTVMPAAIDGNSRLMVRLHGGFGFSTGGFVAAVSAVTERYDDIAGAQLARTALTTARQLLAQFSLNGFGFSVGGYTVAPANTGATERFDDVINTHTARTSCTARRSLDGYSAGFVATLSIGVGIVSGGYIAAVDGTTERFTEPTNAWVGRTAVTPRSALTSYGLNNFGFTSGGSTTNLVAGIVGTTEKYDYGASTQTIRAAITARWELSGYSIGGYGFTSGGQIAGPANTGLTERLDDAANVQVARTALTTIRCRLSAYSLNGFGFTTGGFVAAVSAVTERFDDVANTHTTRIALNTARADLAAYSTNEYYVDYITMDSGYST